MASGYSASITGGSDAIYDHPCTPCEENSLNSEANHYCSKCAKKFCDVCLALHDRLFRSHAVLGKQDIGKWDRDEREVCGEHPDETVRMYCGDHEQACCTLCISLHHRSCNSVSLLQDIAKGIRQKDTFKKLPSDVNAMLKTLESISDHRKQNATHLKLDCKNIESAIDEVKAKVNQKLDQIKTETMARMDAQHAACEQNIQDDIDGNKQMYRDLKRLLSNIEDKSIAETLAFLESRKCEDKLVEIEDWVNNKASLAYHIGFDLDENIWQHFSTFQTFGKIWDATTASSQVAGRNARGARQTPTSSSGTVSYNSGKKQSAGNYRSGFSKNTNLSSYKTDCETSQTTTKSHSYNKFTSENKTDQNKSRSSPSQKKSHKTGLTGYSGNTVPQYPGLYRLYKLVNRMEYNVKVYSDIEDCTISAVCQLPNGHFVIVDLNYKLKLLDTNFKVISSYSLPNVMGVCHVSKLKLAVTSTDNKLCFFNIHKDTFYLEKTVKCEHACHVICCINQTIYISSSTAIYVHNLSGTQIKCLYADNTGVETVSNFSVSPDGEMVYVADCDGHLLTTVNKDGTPVATIDDTSIAFPCAICITGNSDLFVCSHWLGTVYQVSYDGTTTLAEIFDEENKVTEPRSSYFDQTNSQLIIGQRSNMIVVIKIV